MRGPFSLSEAAERDLIEIYKQGLVDFGEKAADRYHDELHRTFSFLAMFPDAGRERPESGRPVRSQPKSSHVIIYEVVAEGIRVVRIFHHLQDWQDKL
ncbi:type II toxin-antitoxin system RelE/ParE family toxin [Devosia sp.]|uniref:type II toxin-antitoxin system RelE/ParE family toxin n=1 Tax=Devosia sp. TaxID=1871048 RepID=UPI00344BAD25